MCCVFVLQKNGQYMEDLETQSSMISIPQLSMVRTACLAWLMVFLVQCTIGQEDSPSLASPLPYTWDMPIGVENGVDDCAEHPCQNGGSCYDEGLGYSCNCIYPYFGQRCQFYDEDRIPSMYRDDTKQCRAFGDIVYLLDSSDVTVKNWIDATFFVARLTMDFIPGVEASQFGAVSFSDRVEKAFDLGNYHGPTSITRAVVAVPKLGGASRATDAGLEYVRSHMFAPSAGGRTDAKKVLVIFTHGEPADLTRAFQTADLVKSSGIRVVSVGVGDVSRSTLERLATSTDDVFYVTDFGKLLSLRHPIRERLCSVTKMSKIGLGGLLGTDEQVPLPWIK